MSLGHLLAPHECPEKLSGMLGTTTGNSGPECQSEPPETPDPPILLALSLSVSSHRLPFLSSDGSECSGLQVLSRCVGIGENIKVKRKGAQKTPGNSATCASICVQASQGKRYLFAYPKCVCVCVCVSTKGDYFYLHLFSPLCVCLFVYRYLHACVCLHWV